MLPNKFDNYIHNIVFDSIILGLVNFDSTSFAASAIRSNTLQLHSGKCSYSQTTAPTAEAKQAASSGELPVPRHATYAAEYAFPAPVGLTGVLSDVLSVADGM